MSSDPKPLSDAEAGACLSDPNEHTRGFFLQQTMYRIKDPEASLKFYTDILGMRLLAKFDLEPMKFTAYFMGYENAENIPASKDERLYWAFTRKGCLELVHNWGTEGDPDFSYHNGNADPGKGFGHIGITVPDVYKACEYFESKEVEFLKKPDGGKMKGIAFIKDPDGYWIEILSPNNKISLN